MDGRAGRRRTGRSLARQAPRRRQAARCAPRARPRRGLLARGASPQWRPPLTPVASSPGRRRPRPSRDALPFLGVTAVSTSVFLVLGVLTPVLPQYVRERLHGGSVAV